MIKMTDYISDIRKTISTLGEITYPHQVFKKYHPTIFKDDLYISPFDDDPIIKQSNIKKSGLFTDAKPDLLISLLNLSTELHDLLMKKQIDNIINLIIKWCSVYGMPYEDVDFSNEYTWTADNGNKMSGGYMGFSAVEFIYRIRILYECWLLWHAALSGDIDIAKKDAVLFNLGHDKSDKELTIDIMEMLAEYVPENIGFVTFSLEYNADKNNFVMTPYKGDRDKICLAFYHLQMLMISKQNNIKFCSKCLKPFNVEHANRDLCDVCKSTYHRDYMSRIDRRKTKNKTRLPTP